MGSFEEGYELDAVILDDKTLPHPQELILRDLAGEDDIPVR